MTTGTAPQTELDAVNMMLEAIFEAPVNTLEVAGIQDVAIAQRTLSAQVREVCLKSLAYNFESEVTLPIDSLSGKIPLPLNVLRVSPTKFSTDTFVQRGSFLYDPVNHTYLFPAPVKANITYHMEWLDLPEHVKYPVAVLAARRFQKKVLGDADKGGFDKDDETNARALLFEADTDTEEENVFNDSWSVAAALQR